MPTYEYQCSDCGKKFEELQTFSEPPIEKCIYCGGKSERLVSGGAGIIFKGSGFYVTDSKKSSGAAILSKESNGKNSSESTSAETSSTTENKAVSEPASNKTSDKSTENKSVKTENSKENKNSKKTA